MFLILCIVSMYNCHFIKQCWLNTVLKSCWQITVLFLCHCSKFVYHLTYLLLYFKVFCALQLVKLQRYVCISACVLWNYNLLFQVGNAYFHCCSNLCFFFLLLFLLLLFSFNLVFGRCSQFPTFSHSWPSRVRRSAIVSWLLCLLCMQGTTPARLIASKA